MAGVAQVWLTEDELDFLVKAAVRYVPKLRQGALDPETMATRRAVIDKLRPLAYGTSCQVSSDGGAVCKVGEPEEHVEPQERVGKRWCPGDYLTELK